MLLLSSGLLAWLLAAASVPTPALAARKEEGLIVLGGEDVTVDEFDFVVGIIITQKNAISSSTCTGSILTSHWILTAAHCVYGTSPSTHTVVVDVGSKRLAQAQKITAEKWIPHERYRLRSNPTRAYYDIALIKLPESVTRIANTATATVPTQDEAAPRSGSTVTVVGFGLEGEGSLATTRRGVLKKANMSVRGTCTNTFPYCVRAMNLNGRSCPGDSGGPMLYNGKVIGVGSTGETCTTRNGDAQYTQVSRYITWIQRQIAQG